MKSSKDFLYDHAKQRFSIRKLTIGTASVLLGMTFMTQANAHLVHADNLTNSEIKTNSVKTKSQTPVLNKATISQTNWGGDQTIVRSPVK